MSRNSILVIPENPTDVPDVRSQSLAREPLAALAPDASEVVIRVSDRIEFIHCGANFESIRCPFCSAEIDLEWWKEQMDADSDDGFRLDVRATPCCNRSATLHQLRYEWPQGFGRFSIEAVNPNIEKLDDSQRQELERILGMNLRVIYQHL